MFKIIDRHSVLTLPESREALEKREACRWVETQIGDLDELHAEFLNKLHQIRLQLKNSDELHAKTKQTENAIKSPVNHSTEAQRPIDTDRLLELI